jgi:hypothetical protein
VAGAAGDAAAFVTPAVLLPPSGGLSFLSRPGHEPEERRVAQVREEEQGQDAGCGRGELTGRALHPLRWRRGKPVDGA